MVGLIDDVSKATRMTFTTPGDAIVLLGETKDELGGSEYLARIHGLTIGAPPTVDLDGEKRLIEALLAAIGRGVVRSAHDCSEGGLAVALTESCVAERDRMLGADVTLPATGLPMRSAFFGESQGRVVVSTADADAVLAIAAQHGVPAARIGTVRSEPTLTLRAGDAVLESALAPLAAAYHDAIPTLMTRSATAAA
jgi:phosphoribosylformylglycinamidine synthase